MHGIPMVASSPVRHESPIGMTPLEVQAYQPPWKALSEFALHTDLERLDPNAPSFHHLVSQVTRMKHLTSRFCEISWRGVASGEQDWSKEKCLSMNINRHECERTIYIHIEKETVLNCRKNSSAVIGIIADARLRLARGTTGAIGTPGGDARRTDGRRRGRTATAPGASPSGWWRTGHGPASRQHRQLRDLRREWQWLVSPRYGKSIVSCEAWTTQNYHAPVVLRFRSDPRRGARRNGEMPATEDVKRPRDSGNTMIRRYMGGTTRIPKDCGVSYRSFDDNLTDLYRTATKSHSETTMMNMLGITRRGKGGQRRCLGRT